jgi:hypothetical protein
MRASGDRWRGLSTARRFEARKLFGNCWSTWRTGLWRMPPDAPATKGDIADIMDALRDIETKLLNAFYGYAKSNDRRVLETEGN